MEITKSRQDSHHNSQTHTDTDDSHHENNTDIKYCANAQRNLFLPSLPEPANTSTSDQSGPILSRLDCTLPAAKASGSPRA